MRDDVVACTECCSNGKSGGWWGFEIEKGGGGGDGGSGGSCSSERMIEKKVRGSGWRRCEERSSVCVGGEKRQERQERQDDHGHDKTRWMINFCL